MTKATNLILFILCSGIDWLDAVENCFSYDVTSLCIDLFTNIYEKEPELSPFVTPTHSEVAEELEQEQGHDTVDYLSNVI